MKVPLLDLQAQYARVRAEIEPAVKAVFESQRFILGPEVDAFETEAAAFCEVPHAVGCGSGTDALMLALTALGVGPGDEVIVPTFTFFATASCVARLGATPVFADLDPVTYNVCPRSVEARAAACTRLKAIVPVHLYGQAAALAALLGLAERFGVPLVEDTAQAIGARDAGGLQVGSRGAVGCVSCFPSKNLGAFGEAGFVTTHDAALAERLRAMRHHGMRVLYEHEELGMNARLDALQAAVLRVKLRHLAGWSAERAERAATYDAAFAAAGGAPSDVRLGDGGLPLRTPRPPAAPATHVYHQYVIRVPAAERDGLRRHLEDAGIGTQIYYPIPLHRQPCFAHLPGHDETLPEAEAASRETLALPVYAELEAGQQAYVVEQVVGFLRR